MSKNIPIVREGNLSYSIGDESAIPEGGRKALCLFCGTEENLQEHHIIPRNIRKVLGWTGPRATTEMDNRKVIVCGVCHKKLTLIEEPLVFIIKWLKFTRPLPMELHFCITGILKELMENSSKENKKEETK